MLEQKLVAKILDEALSIGGDFAEVFVENTQRENISLSEKQTKGLSTNYVRGVGIRLFDGDFQTYAYTNVITDDNLLRIAKNAAQNLKKHDAPKIMNFNDPEILRQNKVINPYFNVKKKEKIRLLEQLSDKVYQQSPLVAKVMARAWGEKRQILVANSEGLWAEDNQERTRLILSSIAERDDIKESSMKSYGQMCGYELWQHIYDKQDEWAQDVAKRSIAKTYAVNCPNGEMPVVLSNGFGGVIFHEACGHSLEAIAIDKGASEFCGKMGKKIASEVVTAYDNGLIPGAWGSVNIDDEGTPVENRLLIENGILKNYMVDKFYGRKLDLKPNGACRREDYTYLPVPRMSNTYIAQGNSNPDDIIGTTDYGLYAKVLSGGSVNTATGEFNFAVDEGFLIEKGKVTQQVRGARLIGKGIEVLEKIDMVGNDLRLGEGTCGASSGSIPVSVGEPTIRVSGILVGGRG